MFTLDNFATETVTIEATKALAWNEANPAWQELARAKTAPVITPTGTVLVSNRYWSEKLVTLKLSVTEYLAQYFVPKATAQAMLTKLNEVSAENAELKAEIAALKKGDLPSKK